MRTRLAAFIAVSALAAVVACVDLFHSTDFKTLCDYDAQAPDCIATGDSSPDSPIPVDICATSSQEAFTRSVKACAWLAACEKPIGENATGRCIANALLAYDCKANPNRKVKSAAKTFWSCIGQASTCAAVGTCLFPSGASKCAGAGFIGCTDFYPSTRIACETNGNPAFGDNCAAVGQTCSSLDPKGANNSGLCLGAGKRACATTGCSTSNLNVCDDAGLDHGVDCTMFGGGQCVTSGAMPACAPEQSTPETCAADRNITCTSGGVAEACITGKKERVDCITLAGDGGCTPIPDAAVGTTPASACMGTSGCSVDTCAGAILTACVRGRTVSVDCKALGLNACNDAISTLEGTRAACTP